MVKCVLAFCVLSSTLVAEDWVRVNKAELCGDSLRLSTTVPSSCHVVSVNRQVVNGALFLTFSSHAERGSGAYTVVDQPVSNDYVLPLQHKYRGVYYNTGQNFVEVNQRCLHLTVNGQRLTKSYKTYDWVGFTGRVHQTRVPIYHWKYE